MRPFKTLLAVVASILLLGVTSALPASEDSNVALVSNIEAERVIQHNGPLRSLKTTKTNEGLQDEERLDLSFLKKLPGVSSLRKAAAAHQAAVKAKADQKAAELANLNKMFNFLGTSDDQLFKKFEMWFNSKITPAESAKNLMAFGGRAEKEADRIAKLYIRWKSIKEQGMRNF
ncbi:hypothetical protein PHYSODRAFT_285733 [Phytophthora sojae]|uniref:RxLR effector protein n=2 Tax=Phytophthora sojae TaxID=67593 RepID=G4Z777_PHYSP|nr:hypothetical protein PHYSODRAFT_285733 [Phytophthora sojae]AEK81070.1 Avh264 [Phytophthora sojae]EGZ22461.1 hypothetical protein PHYSODRAFT_285733 [Phytophthora sojae]|eukprot:XP_009525178.1 hypothetical protein PHYSODRAFT_285733 [Phytophthora sojae]